MRNPSIFAVTPIISRIFIIGFVLAIDYFIITHGFFPQWQYYIDLCIKVIVGYEILRASMASFIAPLLASLCGLIMMIAVQRYGINFFMVSTINAWGLIIASLVGMILSILSLF